MANSIIKNLRRARDVVLERIGEIHDKAVDITGIAYYRVPLSGPIKAGDEALKVPGYRQTQSYTCGFVAGLMVLHTFRPRASAAKLFRRVNPDPVWGISTPKLVRALRASGIGVSERDDLDFAGIRDAIDDRCPVIVHVRRKRLYYHWVVIYGTGVNPNRVFVVGDGLFHRGACRWSDFRSVWATPGSGLVCWGR